MSNQNKKTMNKLKNISDNSLEDLFSLMADIQTKIEDYSHVAEFLPKSIGNVLDSFQKKLYEEYDKRTLLE